MCKNCEIVRKTFEGAALSPNENLSPVYSLLLTMIKAKRLELYAGDCRFEDMFKILSNEEHFTVSFYLDCSVCGKLYFLGACIRGVPKYLEADYNESVINKTLWGSEGDFFKW